MCWKWTCRGGLCAGSGHVGVGCVLEVDRGGLCAGSGHVGVGGVLEVDM